MTGKIYVQQGKTNPKQYTVTKLVNRVTPEVTTTIKREELETLIKEGITVEITEKKW